MAYLKSVHGIDITIQCPGIEVNQTIEDRLSKMLGRLQKHCSEITSAEVFMEDNSAKSTNARSVSIRLSIPGNDAFAKDNGGNFMALFTSVEDKLRAQLEKRKNK